MVETHKAAILAALAITDELFQSRRGDREIAGRLSAMADEIARLLPPAKRGGRVAASYRRIPDAPALLLPVLAGVAAGLLVALGSSSSSTPEASVAPPPACSPPRAPTPSACMPTRSGRPNRPVGSAGGGRIEALKLREDIDREIARRREEWERLERRADERSRAQERKGEEVEGRERAVNKREEGLVARESALKAREGEADRMAQEQKRKLERIAGLTAEDARREVLQHVEDEARGQAAALARDIKEQARRGADRDARRILSIAIQRLAAEHTAESTVAAVALPSDEMKGRIIGREGRNIRAFETATGVDVIIDDTPDTVVVSCFDPIRREVARRALEALVADGRIHPGRIEEVVAKAQKELEGQLVELGEQAAYDTGDPRPASGDDQAHRTDALSHVLRAEHLRPLEGSGVAGRNDGGGAARRRAAGQARRAAPRRRARCSPTSNEGTHVELGVEVARRYGESARGDQLHPAHHDDVPHESTESVLVQAADAISGARPGARREAFETYVKRLTRLEEIARAFPGVEKSNVIQAGREVRVVVTPERIDDGAAATLSESIARKIENELQYPGQIKVVVIRETRSVDYAR